MSRVKPLRNLCLLNEQSKDFKSKMPDSEALKHDLYLTFKEFIRKVWNPKNFKGHVSPTELMFAISKASNGRFRCGADLLSS